MGPVAISEVTTQTLGPIKAEDDEEDVYHGHDGLRRGIFGEIHVQKSCHAYILEGTLFVASLRRQIPWFLSIIGYSHLIHVARDELTDHVSSLALTSCSFIP
ncbi:hypothetical protein QM012_003301 [Aureobasidium pullulans]|uniref:Uncharacterized protein n=1 Tax=Aureobasidium pullulans TaxID=5580 RepID=A0ABR0T9G8_AURPU